MLSLPRVNYEVCLKVQIRRVQEYVSVRLTVSTVSRSHGPRLPYVHTTWILIATASLLIYRSCCGFMSPRSVRFCVLYTFL